MSGFITLARISVPQNSWREIGVLTTSQVALTTDKSAAIVNALTSTGIVIFPPTDNTVAVDFRFRGVASDGDNNTLNLYAMRGDSDHYTRIATLALTTGTQRYSTTQVYSTANFFVDTIAITNEKWGDDIVDVSDADNGIAHIVLNTHGYSNFLFIATTLNSASIIIEVARE